MVYLIDSQDFHSIQKSALQNKKILIKLLHLVKY